MNNKIGIITEQGDLGLGFDQLKKKDKKKLKEQFIYKNEDMKITTEKKKYN